MKAADTRIVSAELSAGVSVDVPPEDQEVEGRFMFQSNMDGDFDERSEAADMEQVTVDEDGDVVVPRRKAKRRRGNITVHLRHHRATTLDLVGLQVWKGALLLCDFLLMLRRQQHMVDSPGEQWAGGAILELGAGSGLPSILCSRHVGVAAVLTDYGPGVLDLATQNVQLNHLCSTTGSTPTQCLVRKLDWTSATDVAAVRSLMTTQSTALPDTGSPHSYAWCESDRAVLSQVGLLLAADVVYDDDLTLAFFSVLRALLGVEPCRDQSDKAADGGAREGGEGTGGMGRRQRRCVVALEKRWNFSLEHMQVEAHGYATFRSQFRNVSEEAGQSSTDGSGGAGGLNILWGRKIDIDHVPQYSQDYHRGDDLELWEVFAAPSPP